MKKILVTGAAGFIGSHTIVELLNRGFDVIGVDNFDNSFPFILENIKKITGKSFVFKELDVRDKASLLSLLTSEKPDGVIHFAAYKAVGASMENPLEYYDNNVGSLVNLISCMREAGVKSLVFSSSCTVYGEPNELPVFEGSQVVKPNSPYGNTKKICEEIIQDCAVAFPDFKAVLLRYFNPIGAHESGIIGELPIGKPNNLIPFITQTAIGKRDHLTIFGDDYDTKDGTCVRDYIHVVDLATAHIKSLGHIESMENNIDVLNVGTGNGNTVLEVVKAFEGSTGVKLNFMVGPRRPGDVIAVYANTDKLKKTLGWEPTHSLEAGLKSAWEWEKWLKNNTQVIKK
jgi:UDP-glucose 4-epimerase